jgi:hypothetical protein
VKDFNYVSPYAKKQDGKGASREMEKHLDHLILARAVDS